MPQTKRPKLTRLRSEDWFNRTDNISLSAVYLERFLNYGLSTSELQSGNPIIGIAQTGSDLSPCNRHHINLAARVREGIRTAGGVAMEFPMHPIQETCKRPTASLDRNLAYLSLVEVLYGYPLDGVVLMTGCDKTTPACLMAAATVNIPAIVLSGGPMLNGWHNGRRTGSGSIVWEARDMLAKGEIDRAGYFDLIASSAPSIGHCNTMGTATTMNSLAETLGMSLPGCAAIPAPYRERAQIAYETGCRIVPMVFEDIKPSDILTRQAFENSIVVNTAIGGSPNAPIHVGAIARHAGVKLTVDDWETIGYGVPLLVNTQPLGEYLAEEFHRAGGVPAVVGELLKHGLIHNEVLTVNGRTLGENCRDRTISDKEVIRPFETPLAENAGFRILRGNLFDNALIKTSAISTAFRERYLSNPGDPNAFEGRAIVFDGPEDYLRRIDDPNLRIDENCILFMRGTGPIGYPGAAEVVNMQAPSKLAKQGISDLPCVGDGRQSGTSGSPSILNASPEAAVGGGLALLRTGDQVRIDFNSGTVDMMVSENEVDRRRKALDREGGFHYPESQTPWQEIQRSMMEQLSEGMVLTPALRYQRIAQEKGVPRDNELAPIINNSTSGPQQT